DAYALQANGNLWSQQELRPGASATINLTNANPAVGTLTQETLTLTGHNGYRTTTQFHPATAGTTTITLTQPTGYTTPNNGHATLTINVTAPAITLNNVSVGEDLQTSHYTVLGVVPLEPTDVTVTVASETTAVLSTDAATAGTKSITIQDVTNTSAQWFSVQGLAKGSTTVTVSAPGYADTTATITVLDSGFQLSTGTLNTTTFSPNSNIHIDARSEEHT